MASYVLHDRDGAQPDERDGHWVGADAVARRSDCGLRCAPAARWPRRLTGFGRCTASSRLTRFLLCLVRSATHSGIGWPPASLWTSATSLLLSPPPMC